MKNFVLFIDRLSAGVGKAFSWCVVIMALGTGYDIVMRYLFHAPTAWAFDVSYFMYGALFIMAGAYTLSRNGHVRCDFVYQTWRPRVQAAIDLALSIAFLLPVFLAVLVYGIPFAGQSWSSHEVSVYAANGAPVYPLKALIPIAAALMLLQCLAEIVRCVLCLRDGVWPQRPHDVEEMESAILAEAEDRRRIQAELHVRAPR